MKNLLGAVLTLSLLIFAICCQKGSFTPFNSNGNNNNNNNNNNSNDTTSPSAVGVPTGPTISKFIGSGGGSLTTADGRMEIDIPAGALASSENITIQNITNTADSATGDAYRFLPNGLKFASPVTIKFHYTDNDVSESAPELLGIAYQDSANFWKPIQLSNLDTTAKMVAAQTNHFTDYLSFRTLRITPVSGDLIQRKKIFIDKQEIFQVYVAHKSNIAKLDPISVSAYSGLIEFYPHSKEDLGTGKYGIVAHLPNITYGTTSVEQVRYTAPSIAPPDNENPITLYAEIHVWKQDPSLKDVLSALIGDPNSLQATYTLRYKIKILDYNVYRFDIVDLQTIGCNTINVYDSTSIFFRVGPDNSETYTVSQDSIINLQPLASPTEADCNKCHFTWISEPIGTVNVTSASVTYSGGANSYFVLLNWVEANENGVWYSEACPGADAKESKNPSSGFGPIEIPMNINTSETQLDTLVEGTADKRHLRLVLIKSNMN